jgi:hypothetical protein
MYALAVGVHARSGWEIPDHLVEWHERELQEKGVAMGTLEENLSLIATKLKEIQEAPTFRNNVVFTADPERGYYAQFLCGGGDDSSAYGELVSNAYLDPPFALSLGQIHDLLHRGWTLRDKNFEKTWLANDDDLRLKISREIMSAFLDIYDVPMEAQLTAEVHLGDEPHPEGSSDGSRINIDADQRNADWIKTLQWDLPTDKESFLAAIGGESELAHFMTLPAAEAMPPQLGEQLGVEVPKPPRQ